MPLRGIYQWTWEWAAPRCGAILLVILFGVAVTNLIAMERSSPQPINRDEK